MKTVKTVWEWSVESEAKRLIHAAHSIATGFFRANNFFVVPWKPGENLTPMTVPFPDLPYHTIPRFWDRVKRVDIRNFPLDFDRDLVSGVTGLLKGPIGSVERPGLLKKAGPLETWNKACGEILAGIYKIMPDKNGCISQIIIHPTHFGTTCSFSVADSVPAAVEMYLRTDQDIYVITEAILSAITRHEVYEDLDGLWSESELLVDWLLTKSSLSPILKRYQPITTFMPTVKYTRMKQSAALLKISEEYYRKLGVPVSDKVFGIKDGTPTITGKTVKNLTPREMQILKLLIENNNSVVEIDKLADVIFSEGEEFSLWAIAKVIQRLRDKLEQNGISGSFIQTLRGQGYILKN